MREHSEENLFDVLWQGRAALVDELLAAGETSLPRVLGLVAARARRNSLDAEVVLTADGREMLTGRTTWQPRRPDPAGHPDARLPDGRPLLNWTVIAGACTVGPHHAPYDGVAVRTLLDLARQHAVDAIVEMGSGMGLRLFELYLAGGPANIPYFGAELFPSGRAVADRLAALEPGLDFRSVPFDLKAPDFSFLAGFRRVLLFSNAAVYCVQHLPASFFATLASAAPVTIGAHFELLSHQTGSGLDPQSSHYAQAVKNRRNEDFFPLLLAAERDGTLGLDYLGPHIYSVSSNHPVTVALWHAQRSPS